MKQHVINRRNFMAWTAMILLSVAGIITPIGQSIVMRGFAELVQITARIVRVPCCLLNHSRCFSLDRLDPTCPQCL
jgi:hypothetical protein